jgi:Na+/H+ antiporter NhaD/arsenite permease-like protein
VRGTINLVLIAAVIGVILGAAFWKPGISFDIYGTTVELQNALRDVALLVIAFLSLVLTHDEHREANGFTWDPILEVVILFAGIFACIIPVVAMLQAGKDGPFAWLLEAVKAGDGAPSDVAYFWLTGALSASSTTRRLISFLRARRRRWSSSWVRLPQRSRRSPWARSTWVP